MNMNKCRKPLIQLCDGMSRLVINLSGCSPCSVEPNRLIISQGGCPKYEEICEEITDEPPCGCPPNGYNRGFITRIVEIPRNKVIYPLHEIDSDGNAVFVLDSKLTKLGYGRLNAVVEFGTCGSYEFDIEYTCGDIKPKSIDVQYSGCNT